MTDDEEPAPSQGEVCSRCGLRCYRDDEERYKRALLPPRHLDMGRCINFLKSALSKAEVEMDRYKEALLSIVDEVPFEVRTDSTLGHVVARVQKKARVALKEVEKR